MKVNEHRGKLSRGWIYGGRKRGWICLNDIDANEVAGREKEGYM